jgi:hypothetical protein
LYKHIIHTEGRGAGWGERAMWTGVNIGWGGWAYVDVHKMDKEEGEKPAKNDKNL